MKSTYLFFLLLFAKSESQAFLFLRPFLSTKVATSQTIEHYYYYYYLTYYKTRREREREIILSVLYILQYNKPSSLLSLSPDT